MEDRKPDDKQNRKVFCGGLDGNTTDQSLGEYFCQFGDVEEAKVMTHKESGKSRGFGFVIFTNLDDFRTCLKQKSHEVDGKEIEVKRAYMQQRNSQTSAPPSVEKTKKVFVGGLDAATNKEDIEEAFIGTGCNSVQLMTEKGTERPRGFAFIYFDSVESAGKVCEQKWFKVKGRDVECKLAQSKEAMEMEKDKKKGSYPQGMGVNSYPYGGYGAYDYSGGRRGGDSSRYHDLYDHAQSSFPGGYGRFPSGGYYGSPGSYGYGHPGYDMYHPSRGYEGLMTPPIAGSMGASYGQSASGYGPSRSVEKGRLSARGASFHPYSRR